MAQREDPGSLLGPRPERGQLAWSVLLNGVLVAAFVLGFIPIVAIVHGFIDLGHRPFVSVHWAFAQRWILDSPPSSLVEATA